MKVILTQDLDNLGMRGDLVEVKNGYGRNYLIPRGLAVLATKSNQKRHEEELRQAAHKIEAQREQAEQLAQKIDGTELLVVMRTGDEGRVFGTVTTQQVADLLKERGFEVDRRKVTIGEEIRTVGVYPATVKVHPLYSAEVKIRVEPEQQAIGQP